MSLKRGEEEVEDQRKRDEDVSIGFSQLGVLDARDMRKYGRNFRVPLYKKDGGG